MKDVNETWEPELLGNERLDAQHRQLFKRLRGLAAAVTGGKTDEVRIALRILSLSVAEHWRDEGRSMDEVGYPGARDHARRHAELEERIARALKPDACQGLKQAATDISLALQEHMRGDDLRLARFLAARANFRAMGTAGPGMALTPIPGTHRSTAPPFSPGRPGAGPLKGGEARAAASPGRGGREGGDG